MRLRALSVSFLVLSLVLGVSAEQCGWQAGGALCPNNLCCSQYGWCGSTDPYCGNGCQSQCDGGSGGGSECDTGGGDGSDDSGNLISRAFFEEMLKHRNDVACPARCFYTYDAFIEAAAAFPEFGTTGDNATRQQEIAAFFGQTSHETTGGWDAAPDGPFAWGYCFNAEINGEQGADYCDPNYPCPKKYFGRGPIQLSWNYNYLQCGEDLGLDLINKPDLLTSDPVISFKSALWFWMKPQPPKPSCHAVMVGEWKPTPNDLTAGRVPGYGMTTNIINGGLECGFPGPDRRVEGRIGFYKRYCEMLEVDPGENLDCYSQRPYGYGLLMGIK